MVLSRIGENMGNVDDTIITAGQHIHAMAHSAASVGIENTCKGLTVEYYSTIKGNELLV